MLTKNSFKNLYRTPLKTGLFIILLAAVTVFLCVGVNMWLSVNQSLASANQAFRTIGVIEYRDPEEPSRDSHFCNYDFSPITNSGLVKFFDQRLYLSGFSEEITISKALKTSRLGYTYSIFEFTLVEILNDGKLLTAEIQKVLHTDDFSIKEGAVILLKIAGEQEFNLKSGRKYITCVYKGWDPEIEQIYCISPPAIQSDLFWLGYSWHSNEFFKEAVMEITDKNYLGNGAGQMWSDLIEMYRNSLHTATVFSTNDLETILIFHKDNALVTSGRTISREDYQLGNRVCLISSNMAKLNGLELGDCVSLTFSEPSVTAIRNSIMSAESINHRNILEEACFEIIGLYQVAGKMNGPYGLFEDTIFIPQKSMDYWPDAYVTMDNFVSFRLTNGTVEAFLKEMEEHELPGLSFTFYDQGYSKVVGALTSMKKTALLLTGVCALVGLGIVLLFSLLFVGRQQRSIAIMYSLGTSRSKALGFLLITVLIVVLLGAGIGGAAGYSLSDRVLADVFARNTEKEAVSAAYSEVYGEDTEADFQAIAPDKPLAPLAATGIVLLATLLFSGLFAARVLWAEPIQVLTQKEE